MTPPPVADILLLFPLKSFIEIVVAFPGLFAKVLTAVSFNEIVCVVGLFNSVFT
jgi:hypothetical protein